MSVFPKPVGKYFQRHRKTGKLHVSLRLVSKGMCGYRNPLERVWGGGEVLSSSMSSAQCNLVLSVANHSSTCWLFIKTMGSKHCLLAMAVQGKVLISFLTLNLACAW